MADRSIFDGRSLTVYGSDGSIVGSWPAISGRSGHQRPSEQNLPFQGPLTGDIQPLTTLDAAIGLVPRHGRFPGSVAAWGTERVPLVPDSLPANGRNNFFIHGGVTPGSAGCIDLGPSEKAYFDALRSTGEPSHEVIVRYDHSLETSPHPLAGSAFWNGASEYLTRPLPGLASRPAQGTAPATPGAAYSPDGNLGTSSATSKNPVRYLSGVFGNKPPPTVFDTGAPPVWFPLETLLSPDREPALTEWSAAVPRSPAAPPAPAPPQPSGSAADLIMNRIRQLNAPDQRSSAAVPGAAAPPVPPDGPNFTGGLAGRIAALAGIDPQNPNQFAQPPLDDQLRGFYRDDPTQPWLLQRRR